MLSNILNLALGVIRPVQFQYQEYITSTINSIGIKQPSYSQPKTVSGSIQPVNTGVYQAYGLDFMKEYIRVYVPAEVRSIDRQATPDRIIFQGKTYVIIQCQAWHFYDGWNELIAVRDKDYVQE